MRRGLPRVVFFSVHHTLNTQRDEHTLASRIISHLYSAERYMFITAPYLTRSLFHF